MTRAPPLVLALALVCMGCTANFFVGEMPETETDGAATSDTTTGGATVSGPSSVTTSDPSSPSTTVEPTSATSMSTTQGEAATVTETTDPTTVSETETMPTTTEGSTSSSSAEEASGTTETPTGCAAHDGLESCEADGLCNWNAETSICVDDPCEMENDCSGLGMEDCNGLEQCVWVPFEAGTCYLNECVPCAMVENNDICMAALNCMWNEGEMVCVPID